MAAIVCQSTVQASNVAPLIDWDKQGDQILLPPGEAMTKDTLADYFYGIAAKSLSFEDARHLTSDPPELIASAELDRLLGSPEHDTLFPSTLIYLCEKDEQPIFEDADIYWCGTEDRAKPRAARRKLLCRETTATSSVAPGDTLLIARRQDSSLLVILAESESTGASQLRWLFSLTNLDSWHFSVRLQLNSDSDRIDFARYFLLENLGVEVHI